MLFSSVEFLFRFLPVFMLLYLIVPAKYRNFVLLAGSLVFYGVGEPYFVLLLIFSVVVNYGISKYMFWEPAAPIQNRVQRRVKRRRAALIISLVFDFSLLFLFKYWDFAAGTVNQLAGSELIPVLALTLPLGISFYTFQMVSYQVDCYRGVIEEPPGFVPFAAYVSMFPQLIAGPIVRYDEVADRMCGRRMRIRNLENGLKLFTLGLGLKVLLANQIGTLWNTIMTAGAGNLHPGVAWLGAAAYSFQIYFDFSGYSDMAVGLGKMFNIEIPVNFLSPYKSYSILEFWKRWHITLTRFLRNYVYIPLGGNKKGYARTYVNIILVFLLSGVWHGANWTFILWGVLHGLAQVLNRFFEKTWNNCNPVFRWLCTFSFINIMWLLFRADSVMQAMILMKRMFVMDSLTIRAELYNCFFYALPELGWIAQHFNFLSYLTAHITGFYMWTALAVAVFMCLNLNNLHDKEFKPTWPKSLCTPVLLIWSIVSLGNMTTFLYFNF